VRVATYNVHDCVGRDGRFDPARIASILVEIDAEIIALQEVTLDHAGELINRFEAATQRRLIDGTLFARGIGRYGNIVLTRRTVVETRLHDLSYDGREPRGAIDISVDAGNSLIRVCATHIGFRRCERNRQMGQLAALLSCGHKATLLLGDFNVWWRSTALAPLTRNGFDHVAVRSFPTSPFPIAALDRIFARLPFIIERCWCHKSPLARIASDHFPVVAELQMLRAGIP
jgi:endonuclease/exonuclease/phosphatase family metal-dependent hydrolase